MVGHKEAVVLGRPGNDLLSRVLRHSTIGAEEFNGRVRDGIGFGLLAHITGPAKDNRQGGHSPHPELFQAPRSNVIVSPAPLPDRKVRKPERASARRRRVFLFVSRTWTMTDMDHESNQANRAISTSQLNTSPRLHSWPINVVVFHGSQGRTRFKGGFPLRCLQRLSRPYIAMLHCGWRHNSSTRGTSIPVLSY